MSNIDEQFVDFVVKSLVNKPDEVKIERRIDEKGVLLELTVDPEDLGRVIGKRGATAQSIRTLLRALGTKNDARYNLKIVDNGTYEHAPRRDDDAQAAPAPAKPKDDVIGDVTQDDAAAVVDEIDLPETEEEVVEERSVTSDKVSQARKELEEMDDLDL
ncbi:MAG TPA: KH domain-containing protein [Candidatus Saccharimonadales bacterium]